MIDHKKSIHGFGAFMYDFVKGTNEINGFMAAFILSTDNRMKFSMKIQKVIYEQTKSSHNLTGLIHGFYKANAD